ncbi:sulfotransferase family 2 domain-containing protein [uncultured Marinobacter sp.]|uniref:sulfotransferase family 2 domain-containing protein n=1 Tax=uncultured Marinobacter sp. TaxID=187379 RepID=UPI00260CB37F|nr:sulfotransferase family 2 domain-containing protein [uncultured Marinobacter sp.]
MAIICREHGLLFLMAPRTGCTAIGSVLMDELGGEWLPGDDVVDENGLFVVQKKHCTLQQLLEHNIISEGERTQLVTFTAVRNPFDSLVSLYFKMHKGYQDELNDPDSWVYKVPGYADDLKLIRNMTFDQWINRFYPDLPFHLENRPLNGMRNVAKRLVGKQVHVEDAFVQGVDHVMRFEHLQDDFSRVLHVAGVRNPPVIPMINTTKARSEKDYRSLYTPKTRRKVEVYKEGVLKEFGYTF